MFGHFIAVRHRFWKLILRLMRFVGNVSALFVVAVSHGFWCLTFHSGPLKVPLKVLEAHSAPNAFRRQRFGIVRGRCFAWFGHESCCCSAVSEAVGQRLWTLAWWLAGFFFAFRSRFQKQRFGSFLAAVSHGLGHYFFLSSFSDIVRLMRFVGNISALFVVAVSHGLGTNPAAVRRLRKRSAKGLGR